MKKLLGSLVFGNRVHQLLLFSLIACTGAAANSQPPWKEIVNPSVSAEVLATQVRVITRWTTPAGSDSVRVQVSYGTQPAQNKQYVPVRTADTTFFNAVAGESSSGASTVTAVKIGRVLTPVTVTFGPITIPIPDWPAVTGVTATADTL